MPGLAIIIDNGPTKCYSILDARENILDNKPQTTDCKGGYKPFSGFNYRFIYLGNIRKIRNNLENNISSGNVIFFGCSYPGMPR